MDPLGFCKAWTLLWKRGALWPREVTLLGELLGEYEAGDVWKNRHRKAILQKEVQVRKNANQLNFMPPNL